MNKITLAFILVFAFSYILNIADLYSTILALPLGAVEMNPLFQHYNTDGIGFIDILWKLIVPFTFFVPGLLANKYYPKLGVIATIIAVGILSLYVDTVLGNILVLRELLSL